MPLHVRKANPRLTDSGDGTVEQKGSILVSAGAGVARTCSINAQPIEHREHVDLFQHVSV